MSTPSISLIKSEQLNEHENAEILTLLQSSEAESSSEDDLIPPSNKMVTHDSSSDDASVWKAAANLVNYIKGAGFLASYHVVHGNNFK